MRLYFSGADVMFLKVLGHLADSSRKTPARSALLNARELLDRLCLRLSVPPIWIRRNGDRLHGYLRHRSVLTLLANGQYECFSQKLVEAALAPDVTVIDAGAHIGTYSLLAHRVTGGAANVYAFEPDPYNYQALAWNIRHRRSNNTVLSQKALSSCRGTVTFYISSGTIGNSLIPRKAIGRLSAITADATTLDDELKQVAVNRLVIKLDVEGGELLALDGMRETLAKAKSVVLIVEVNKAALQDSGSSPQQLRQKLADLGFRVSVIDEVKGVAKPFGDIEDFSKGHLYCIKGNAVPPGAGGPVSDSREIVGF